MTAGEPNKNDERLRRIEAVTDAALSHLDADDLLDQLLDRVRELMTADTAAILLLDQHAQHLVATAAKGLEAEVQLEVRIPVGRGFAGRVAYYRRPVVIDQLRPADAVNPLLYEKGITSLLGVPILSSGDLVGVLHVGTLSPRVFTDDDIRLLQLVADRASLATQARSARVDRAAALALQRSLLPTRLPEIAGIQLAARYVPGHHTGVGGDWYDVFVLPSGWLGVVVGDVSGHGLRAAVVMGRLRSALRAYALECDDPADALTRLDRKIFHFEAGSLTTALYAMVSPDQDRMAISLAGHLPPMYAAPGEPAAPMSLPVDLPLGTGSDQSRRYTTIELAKGSTLVCYTDGLIERRREPIDAGIERLRRAVQPGPAGNVCAAIMELVADPSPNNQRTDDTALLVISRVDTPA